MAIHWYPGHMHKAQKEIRQLMPKVDLVIEVLDARIPYSSENPLVAQLRGDKPCLKVLSKSDLADPEITAIWQAHLEQERQVKALPLSLYDKSRTLQLTSIAKAMFPSKDKSYSTINTLIVGIPNVGKSTLINTLAGRPIAKTGNEPAVTKGQQRINLDNGIVLFDTPGILWPKVDNELSSYRLAASGAIRDTAMDYVDVAFFAARYLLECYPEALHRRYELKVLPSSEVELLEAIGSQRGCLRAGGQVDLNKVSELLIRELRSAQLGRITLETPAMIQQELVQLAEQKQQKAARDEERKARFKNTSRESVAPTASGKVKAKKAPPKAKGGKKLPKLPKKPFKSPK